MGIHIEHLAREENLGALLNVVDDFKLLAMNARIEAARAGELGLGFGVIAEQFGDSTDTLRQVQNDSLVLSRSTSEMFVSALSLLER